MMLLLAFAVLTGLGLGLGLWDEFSEQRRLGRAAAVMRGASITDEDSNDMARDCRRIGDRS